MIRRFQSLYHILFAGGGTGGHLFPGLAVAAELRADGTGDGIEPRITFAGSGRELEERTVRAAGFEYLALRCRPFPRRLSQVFPFAVENLVGYWQARRFLDQQPVAVVVGLGGYASVPMAWAAVRRGIPLVLLEQNAVAGRATRWLARSAAVVCTAFEETARSLPRGTLVLVTGNPVRPGFDRRDVTASEDAEEPRPHRLLVLGGSSGARSLNESVPRALHKLADKLAGWTIVHQSGQAECESTGALYARLGLRADVVPFLDDMPARMAAADLAVSRAGGTTLAELSAAGVPAVLVPYPYAADDHQRRNADAFAAAGAAAVVDERERAGRPDDRLAEVLGALLTDAARRASMARAMARLAHLHAARDVAVLVGQLAHCRLLDFPEPQAPAGGQTVAHKRTPLGRPRSGRATTTW